VSFLPDETVARLLDLAGRTTLEEGRYVLMDEVGRGGMGTVYRARDERLGRDVAIKVAHHTLASAGLERRMRTEARVLAALEHPGIVPVHDVGTVHDGRMYYVMKLVDGSSLERLLEGLESRDEQLRLLERICEPVAFAHSRGVVHRDLKPANIMVGAFGEVLVMDWGVARVLAEADSGPEPQGEDGAPGATAPGTVMGTPGYMSPEQAAGGAAQADQRADVHALGAILARMLSGQEPSGRFPPELPRLPKRLRAIVERAMAPDPRTRYEDAGALARDIARFREGRPVEAWPEGVLERAWRLAGRYRTPILLVLAYLVMRMIVALAAR
jgi:serine/threonine protein kinase